MWLVRGVAGLGVAGLGCGWFGRSWFDSGVVGLKRSCCVDVLC